MLLVKSNLGQLREIHESHAQQGIRRPRHARLEDMPAPEPKAVSSNSSPRVRGELSGCTHHEDKYQFKPERPFAPGGEVAGEIDAVGEGVTDVAVGDRVMALVSWGGMAEQVTTPAVQCVPMPDTMPFHEAAALIFTYGTSYHALKQRANIRQATLYWSWGRRRCRAVYRGAWTCHGRSRHRGGVQ